MGNRRIRCGGVFDGNCTRQLGCSCGLCGRGDGRQEAIKGALIVGVFINSPADMAGIRADDIVVAVNDNPVTGIRDLLDQITLHKPEEQIQISIYRGPQKMTLDMKTTQRP